HRRHFSGRSGSSRFDAAPWISPLQSESARSARLRFRLCGLDDRLVDRLLLTGLARNACRSDDRVALRVSRNAIAPRNHARDRRYAQEEGDLSAAGTGARHSRATLRISSWMRPLVARMIGAPS